MRSAGLCALPIFAAGVPRLADGCVDESKAKLTREPFGELRLYYDGPTEYLKSMTAGSLRLKAGPGTMMYCRANDLHDIKNTGSTSLLFYFYKWKQ